MPEGQKVKTAYAIIYDDSPNHTMGWENDQLKVPAIFDDATKEYSVQTSAISYTSWHNTDHKYHIKLFAEDDAGNVGSMDSTDETYGSQLAIRVLEKGTPVIKPITSQIYDSYTETSIALPMIGFGDGGPYEIPEWTADDLIDESGSPFISVDKCSAPNKGSGLDFSTLKYYLDGKEFIPEYYSEEWDIDVHEYVQVKVDPKLGVFVTEPAASDGYNGQYEVGYAYYFVSGWDSNTGCTIENLSTGVHKLKLSISDNDGNEAVYEKEFLIHTSSPYLEIVKPVLNFTPNSEESVFLTNSTTVDIELKVKPNEDGTPIDHVTVEGYSTGGIYGIDETIPFSDFGELQEDGYYHIVRAANFDGLDIYRDDYSYFVYPHADITVSAVDTLGGTVEIGREVYFDCIPPWIEDVTVEKTTVGSSEKIKIQFRLIDVPLTYSDIDTEHPFSYTSTQMAPVTDTSGYLKAGYNDISKIKFKLTGPSRAAVSFTKFHVTSVDPNLQTDFTISEDPTDPRSKIFESTKELTFSGYSPAMVVDGNVVGGTKNAWQFTIDDIAIQKFSDIPFNSYCHYNGRLGGMGGNRYRTLEDIRVKKG